MLIDDSDLAISESRQGIAHLRVSVFKREQMELLPMETYASENDYNTRTLNEKGCSEVQKDASDEFAIRPAGLHMLNWR